MAEQSDHEPPSRSSGRSDARTSPEDASDSPTHGTDADRESSPRPGADSESSNADRKASNAGRKASNADRKSSAGQPAADRNPSGRRDSGSNTRSRVRTAARRTVVTLLVLGIMSATILGLGFLVYRDRVAPGPFLLLVGIVVGFLLGRLDALL